MEENKEILEMLHKIEDTNRQQLRSSKIQCICSAVTAVCCAAILVAVAVLMVQIGSLITNVNDLILVSQNSISQVTEQISTLDFDTLNRAIENLADVIEPLASFFNSFG